MKLPSMKRKFETKFGNVSDVFKNTETDFMYFVFLEAEKYETISEWLREIAIESYYRNSTNPLGRGRKSNNENG